MRNRTVRICFCRAFRNWRSNFPEINRATLGWVRDGLVQIFEAAYRELRPRAVMPELTIEFFAFSSINNTVRLKDGKLRVRLSDLIEGAPQPVLRAILHILLAKIYRKQIKPEHSTRYRRYISSRQVSQKAHVVRQMRGRKRIQSALGQVYDLEKIFEELNFKFFHGLMARPQLTWSRDAARNLLGHYDPSHNVIVISRIFDRPEVPPLAVEYILYHEMLHLKHPVKLRGSRRCVHSTQFQEEEGLFPNLEEAKLILKRL